MAVEAGFDLRELEQLSRDLTAVADRYPEKAKEFLKQQGNKTARLLRAETKKAIKGHRKRRTEEEQKTALLKNVRRGSVRENRDGDYQVRVSNKAPHAHLFEHGHVQWVPAAGKKFGSAYRRKTEQFVPGRHPAARTTNEMKTAMAEDAGPFVDEVLREGGFS